MHDAMRAVTQEDSFTYGTRCRTTFAPSATDAAAAAQGKRAAATMMASPTYGVGSSRLDQADIRQLEPIVANYRAGEVIVVRGHASKTGTDGGNLDLSMRRAGGVASYLSAAISERAQKTGDDIRPTIKVVALGSTEAEGGEHVADRRVDVAVGVSKDDALQKLVLLSTLKSAGSSYILLDATGSMNATAEDAAGEEVDGAPTKWDMVKSLASGVKKLYTFNSCTGVRKVLGGDLGAARCTTPLRKSLMTMLDKIPENKGHRLTVVSDGDGRDDLAQVTGLANSRGILIDVAFVGTAVELSKARRLQGLAEGTQRTTGEGVVERGTFTSYEDLVEPSVAH
jgi:outer membrane protein OmpA-like peptidoglycan-associated protein